jgi:hypothetical protein
MRLSRRWLAVAMVAAWPSARALPTRSVLGAAVLTATPVMVTLARGGENLALASVAAALSGGAAAAYAVDDPAATLLASTPTPPTLRLALRLAAVGAFVGTCWLASWVAGTTLATTAGLDGRALALEAATVAGVSLAIATYAHARLAMPEPGLAGAVTSVLMMLTLTSLSFRYPWLPRLGGGESHHRWWWLAAGGWTFAGWRTGQFR